MLVTELAAEPPAPPDPTLYALQTPCLLLDEARLRANVEWMRAHIAHLGVAFRPHLKTAKSVDVARSR